MATPALSLRHVSAFAADVRESLTKPGQRELPSKYLYDEVGSALFETICVLPEYGLTRADARLLEKYSGEIVSRLPVAVQVAELGSGSGKKTRWILEALSRRQKTYYYPIEISPFALAACEKELGQIDLVSIVGYEQPYLEGLRTVAEGRAEQDHLLVLFLGSTIGNFDRDAGEIFLKEMREILQWGDALLLGTDLEKDVELQMLAYDDPAGVTSAFNLNLLARINRELGVEFRGAAHRDAFAFDAAANGSYSGGELARHAGRRRNHLDRKLAQVPSRRNSGDGGAYRIPLRWAVDRHGVAIRAKPADCGITRVCGPLPPTNLHEYQNKRITKFAFRKLLILKGAALGCLG
jgi:L-histidine Nalpha-methyltransferase